MNILHITSILPAPLEKKKDENDILIRIAQEYKEKYPADNHHFLMMIPYSNAFIGAFKKKWQEYDELLKKERYQYGGFNIYVIGLPAFKNDFRLKTVLTKVGFWLNKEKIDGVINTAKPDMIHAHNLRGNTELAQIVKNRYGVDYIATLRASNKTIIDKINNGYLRPKKLLAINKKTKERLSKMVSLPIWVIPHAVDSDFFIEKYSMPEPNITLRIVSIGRLLKLKNYDKVISVLSKLNAKFHYDIYGDGPELNNLKKISRELGLQENITFYGRVPHNTIKEKMQEYSLLVQASYPETLGRVYFEAMAAGVPVIASKNTGIDGLITDGEEGFLVDHQSEEEILKAIKKFLSYNAKKKMIIKEKAYKTALKYKWNDTLQKYHALYHYLY